MKPAPFEYLRPSSLAEATAMLREHADRDPKLLAGGQSLVPMMNFRMAQPEVLVDLNRVPGLAFVEERGGDIAIGAMTRHNDVARHPLVARHLPLVRDAYHFVAHHTVRNRGTIGGNVCHADSASEMPMVLTTLDARFVVASADARRTVAADDFFLGVYTTAVEPDEVLVEILVPKPVEGACAAFEEVSLRKGDFAIAAVAAEVRLSGGAVASARIGIAGVAERGLRAERMEVMLAGVVPTTPAIEVAADAAIEAIDFSGTAAISAAYRRDLTRALMVRAVSRAAGLDGETTR